MGTPGTRRGFVLFIALPPATGRGASGKPGGKDAYHLSMRVLAVGDIHGCSRAFDALLAAVRLRPGDTLVTLGDYVDRGPDSSGVLQRLCRLAERTDIRLLALRGNHEQMMLDARDGSGELEVWRHCGGDAALANYSVLGDEGRLADVPYEHWALL